MALSVCQKFCGKYQEFVKCNPNLVSELEYILRWMSYLTAGRFDNSSVISELIYALSSLLKLTNDLILRHAVNLPIHINTAVTQLKTCLAVVEYSEVFAELAAAKLGGDFFRWSVITVIQITKSAIRFLLLLKHKQGILKSPPISPLNRKKLPNGTNNNVEENTAVKQPATLLLKRTGRSLRSIDAAPPLSRRNWKVPVLTNKSKSDNSLSNTKVYFPPTKLEGEKLMGEILHISRPLFHLFSIAAFGEQSWKSWFTAIGCDLTSLQLLGDRSALNHSEQLELSRRALILLMYLLRSPLYDKYTKQKILTVLLFISKNIPVVGMFIKPITDYLPDWQKTYFHAWAM